MTILKSLKVSHTSTAGGRPLCVLENLPGEGAEFTPEQLFMLARALREAALECQTLRGQTKQAARVERIYTLQGDPEER